VEDGRFDYIESGSLLGINYREVSSYPVGFEEQITMFPLDFEEFLWAKDIDCYAINKLRQHYTELKPVIPFLHEQIMKLYREYLIVGGMPASVNAFINNDDFNETVKIQNIIVSNYRDDISKYAGKDMGLAKSMFDAIPQQLNSKNKRFILSDLEKGTSARKYENALMWLVDAGIAYNCFNVTSLEPPLAFNEKRNLYKLYLHDTGLLCALSAKGIQTALLNGEINVNEGGITENAVAAALAKKGIPLNYYDKKSRAELDFVFLEDNKISVMEVKSGKDYKKHVSLDRVCENEHGHIGRRIVLSKYNIEINKNGIIYMPLYMVMFL
jgi:predicted AAA+ superfamily ATPase